MFKYSLRVFPFEKLTKIARILIPCQIQQQKLTNNIFRNPIILFMYFQILNSFSIQLFFVVILGCWPLSAQTEHVQVNGVNITYESMGEDDRETILLISGLGAQFTMWPDELCNELVRRGYRVIRFDNRDTGLSTHLDSLGSPDWEAIGKAANSGDSIPLPYSLKDMAEDAVGLLNALSIKQTHIAGASMGGAIAQLIAIHHPHRVLSLTSIFSDTGNPEMPGPTEEVMSMPPAPPVGSDMEKIIEREIAVRKIIESPGYPTKKKLLRKWVRRDVERSYNPVAVERQSAAIMFAGDRRSKLQKLRLPTVVLHGDADILVPMENGEDTAENIPDAELCIIEGLGHDIPQDLIKDFTDAIVLAATRTNKTDKR